MYHNVLGEVACVCVCVYGYFKLNVFSAVACTAPINAPRTPLSSITCNPLMVVPPGELTEYFI